MSAAPYPATTRAKGWRFELDYEQIEQSETWPLAAEIPMAQHALLMMWTVAWSKQVPCGSFPNDESVIRAACRIPPPMWQKLRGVLMRGWWEADDGRLYHPTLTKRVLEMLSRRRSDSDRQAAKRAREAAEAAATNDGVTAQSRVTPAELQPESSTDHRPPTTKEEEKKPRKRASGPEVERPEDVAEQTWLDWLRLRKAKSAPVTATVVAEARKESDKAGVSLDRFLSIWCIRGSQGLQAEWLRADERRPDAPALSFRERETAAATARVHELTGGRGSAKPAGQHQTTTEIFDVTPLALGR